MAGKKMPSASVAQAWIELTSDDPEAASALAVARAHLPAGRGLKSLKRMRLFELSGPLPPRAILEGLLHRSIQFYNPHKERCVVRATAADAAPMAAGDRVVLVFDRGEERRAGAERWWRQETGREIEVREGTAWVMSFEALEPEAAGAATDLAMLRDRRHGLLCNPNAQELRVAEASIPLPWMGASGGS